jgi:hypothetical protein
MCLRKEGRKEGHKEGRKGRRNEGKDMTQTNGTV